MPLVPHRNIRLLIYTKLHPASEAAIKGPDASRFAKRSCYVRLRKELVMIIGLFDIPIAYSGTPRRRIVPACRNSRTAFMHNSIMMLMPFSSTMSTLASGSKQRTLVKKKRRSNCFRVCDGETGIQDCYKIIFLEFPRPSRFVFSLRQFFFVCFLFLRSYELREKMLETFLKAYEASNFHILTRCFP